VGIVYSYLAAALIGAAFAYFFDPDRGRARRAVTRDRLAGVSRRGARMAGRQARHVGSDVQGMQERMAHAGGDEDRALDDATLAQKVMTELFRDRSVPKGAVSVNAENGIVYLRGEIEDPATISMLVERARNVGGVVDVENLLHLPGEPAPRT
jgi:hypothetical protein